MPTVQELPADQRAVLQLLLKQGKSYDEIAGMLDLEPDSVRDRARAAVEALGPQRGRRLAAQRRADIADYLLGQQDEEQAAATREHIAGSAGARAWARAIAGELRPVGGERVPEVPGNGTAAGVPSRSGAARARRSKREKEPAADAATTPAVGEGRAGKRRASRKVAPAGIAKEKRDEEAVEAGEDEREERAAGELAEDEQEERVEGEAAEEESAKERVGAAPSRPSSRLGGALLIGGLAILVVVLLVIVLRGDDDSDSTPTTTRATTQAQSQAQPIAQVNLRGEGKALGVAQIIRQRGQTAVALVAQDVPPSTKTSAYAVWLYTSPSKAKRLGYAPPVTKTGRLQGLSPLPADARSFKEIVVTRQQITSQGKETSQRPGTIVLRGALNLPN